MLQSIIKRCSANSYKELIHYYNQFNGFFGQLLLQEMIEGGEENLYCLKTVLNKKFPTFRDIC